MPDPFKHVRANEPFRPQAAAWNAFVDTTVGARKGKQIGGGVVEDAARPWILVQNVSAEDFDRFDAVGLIQPVYKSELDPEDPQADEHQDEFENNLAWEVDVPEAGDAGRFAILLEAIPAGEFGRAVVSGQATCQVDFGGVDVGHAFADVADGETTLAAAATGSAQILWAAARTGVQWAVVRLSNNAEATAESGSGSGNFCPPGFQPVEVLTGYQCVSGVAIPCVKTICSPVVSATTCGEGGGSSGDGTVAAFDCEVSESLLLTLSLSGCSCGSSLEIALAWNGTAWTGSAVLGSCSSITISATFYETSPNSNIGVLELDSNGHGGANVNGIYVCTGDSLSINDTDPNESVNGWCTGGTFTGFTIEEA